MAKLIIGCGYLGRRVADRWQLQGPVWALTRSPATAQAWMDEGLRPLLGDVLKPLSLPACPDVDTVLFAAAPDRQQGLDAGHVWDEGVRNVLAWLRPGRPLHFLFVSSTSVYGQQTGNWVDESSTIEPRSQSGKLLAAAERWLGNLDQPQLRISILRLAGIYGPGRIPRLEAIRRGEPLPTDPEGWLNLIHVADAVHVIDCLAAQPDLVGTYNVVDDEPIPRREYAALVAALLQAPPPRFAAPPDDAPPGPDSANRRVSNRRLHDRLGRALRYPSCRDALPELLAP
ncbi:MAG TPA: NAD-dependent epimerase/dehydratase family protein, partial [Gemmatales bacterium]|nr:NAD-dependent epimerase/dehydratase family protein [Gemmatales bacterium]